MGGTAKRVATNLKVFGFIAVGLIGLVTWLVIAPPSFDNGSTIVPAPNAQMRAETAAILARASAAQDVCYGWHLLSSGSTVSRGSSLGPDTAVDSDFDRCPSWIEVEATVRYTPASSEAPDTAYSRITASGVAVPPVSHLDRFGLTTDAFIDEPDWAICQAALVLPLLAAESGSVPPAPTSPPTTGSGTPAPATPAPETADPSAGAPAALPDAGSDFWRDRWAFMLGGGFLLLIAALTVAIGWFERQHQRRRPVPPGRPGAAGTSQAGPVGQSQVTAGQNAVGQRRTGRAGQT